MRITDPTRWGAASLSVLLSVAPSTTADAQIRPTAGRNPRANAEAGLPNLIAVMGAGTGSVSGYSEANPCIEPLPPAVGRIGARRAGPPGADSVVVRLYSGASLIREKKILVGPDTGFVAAFTYETPRHCPAAGGVVPAGSAPPPNHRLVIDATNRVAEANEQDNTFSFHLRPESTIRP